MRPRLASHGEPGPLGSAHRGRSAIPQAPRQDPGGLLEALPHGRRLGRLDDAAAGARRARGRVPAGAHARRIRGDERDDGSAGTPRRLRRLGGSRVHGLVVERRRACIRTQRGRSVSARRPPRPARPRRGVRPRGARCRNRTSRRSQRRGQRGGRPRPRVAAPRATLQRPRGLLRTGASEAEPHRRDGRARHPRSRRGWTSRRRRLSPGWRRAGGRGALLARGRPVRRCDRDAASAPALGDRPARPSRSGGRGRRARAPVGWREPARSPRERFARAHEGRRDARIGGVHAQSRSLGAPRARPAHVEPRRGRRLRSFTPGPEGSRPRAPARAGAVRGGRAQAAERARPHTRRRPSRAAKLRNRPPSLGRPPRAAGDRPAVPHRPGWRGRGDASPRPPPRTPCARAGAARIARRLRDPPGRGRTNGRRPPRAHPRAVADALSPGRNVSHGVGCGLGRRSAASRPRDRRAAHRRRVRHPQAAPGPHELADRDDRRAGLGARRCGCRD